MKSYFNFRDKKEINNPTKISFTLEWSIEEIQEMVAIEPKTKGQIEDLIIENEERFMEIIAYIADQYLKNAVSSNGSATVYVPDFKANGTKAIPSALYRIADNIISDLGYHGNDI